MTNMYLLLQITSHELNTILNKTLTGDTYNSQQINMAF